jgi:hypothetical protein
MHDIPILLNHDHTKVIGLWKRGGIAEFLPDQKITKEQLFNIFGGAGIRVIESFEDATGKYVRAFEILEFSLCPSHNTCHE